MSDMPLLIPPEQYKVWSWISGGNPRDLVQQEISSPNLGAGQVLVKNEFIGLNPVDWKVLGTDFVDWRSGHVPGVDGAGVVVDVAPEMSRALIGKRVAYHQGLREQGSFAQYTPVAARALLNVPDALGFDIAASVPCAAMTAMLALQKLPVPYAGAELLVSGAGGAVGNYLVQIAHKAGWRVTALSNPRHWERLLSFGAEATHERILASDSTSQFAAIIDMVGEDRAFSLTPLLRTNGHIVAVQGRLSHWPCQPFGRAISMHEVALGALHYHGDDQDWSRMTKAADEMLVEIAEGSLVAEPLVTRVFDELPVFLDHLKHRDFTGKPIVKVS